MTAVRPAARQTSRPAGQRPQRYITSRLTRRLHSWLSMIGLVLLLFFAVTGLTLNHQDWTFGQRPTTTTVTGQLPGGCPTEDPATPRRPPSAAVPAATR